MDVVVFSYHPILLSHPVFVCVNSEEEIKKNLKKKPMDPTSTKTRVDRTTALRIDVIPSVASRFIILEIRLQRGAKSLYLNLT